MKTRNLFNILLFVIISYSQSLFAQPNNEGTGFENPIVVGSYSSEFAYEHQNDSKIYKRNDSDDIELYYQLTLHKAMNIHFHQCNPDENKLIKLYFGVFDSNMQIIAMNPFDNPSWRIEAGKYLIRVWGNHPLDRLHLLIDGYTDYALDANTTFVQKNFIETIIPTKGITAIAQADSENSQRIIQYFDGFGKLQEEVNVAFTPGKLDLATYQEYDDYGRVTRKWLPAVSDKKGKFLKLDSIRLSSFVTNGDYMPYHKFVYEDSPLSRVKQSWRPGKMWYDNIKAINTSYTTNNNINGNSLRCAQYIVVRDSSNVSLGKIGYYFIIQPNTQRHIQYHLHVEKKEDEDGNEIFNFKDCNDRLLLVRQIIDSKFCDTYYVYDEFDNLCYVLPPIASDSLTDIKTWKDNDSILANYAYLYKYDKRHRCIAKKLPGCDWTKMIYDAADRLIFAQDGELRKKGEWLFTIPDAFGRVVLTGTCKDIFDVSDKPVKGVYSSIGSYKGYSIQLGGVDRTFLVPSTILSVNYYDSYDFRGSVVTGMPSVGTEYNVATGYGMQYAGGAKGLLTGTLTAQMNADGTPSSTYLFSVIYYDNRGRVIQTKSNNPLAGGIDQEYLAYDFVGNVIQRKHVHQATGKTPQAEIYQYEYDHAGRLLNTTHKLNTKTEITLADNVYDELGRLKADKRNGNAKFRTDYKYNVRSWTKSITNPLFSQTLYYNDKRGSGTLNTPTYNGNISGVDWTGGKGYNFMYDDLSRLTTADYLENNVGGMKFNTSYSYDKHGNMLTLSRYGNQTVAIDNLTFTYQGNQLMRTDDTGTNSTISGSMDFKNGTNTGDDYAYDANGNLTKDLNKNIVDIQYNVLLLPSKVTFGDGNSVVYKYAADGKKLQTVHTIGGATTTTDYVGNMIYENGTLKRILVDGGYYENDEYYFYLKDHLGNNRVVAKQDGTVVQTNDYYPFGANFAESISTDVQSYKYNGKELDTKGGLKLYDYGARHYDPVLGRFMTVDPMAEKYYSVSPYAYCGNNPIMLVDVNGKEWGIVLNANGTKTVTLAVNFNVDSSLNLTSSQINAYKTAISAQLNNTFQEASEGMVSTAVTFYSGNENISQSLSLGKMDGTLGGGTTYFSSSVNLFNPRGELRSLSNIASDATHEVLHTLRLGHPFELTQTADTELVRVAPNSFVSTSTTDKNIVNNIMNYPQITIDGMKGCDQNMLTKGQLNYILNEINLQKQGYGFAPKYNSVLTPEQNANLYKQYYEDYWLNFPGTPVHNQ